MAFFIKVTRMVNGVAKTHFMSKSYHDRMVANPKLRPAQTAQWIFGSEIYVEKPDHSGYILQTQAAEKAAEKSAKIIVASDKPTFNN